MLYVNTVDDYFAVIVAREEMTDGGREIEVEGLLILGLEWGNIGAYILPIQSPKALPKWGQTVLRIFCPHFEMGNKQHSRKGLPHSRFTQNERTAILGNA